MLFRKYKYDVALSFAEEDRAIVQQVANHLKSQHIRMFYDQNELIVNWGERLEGFLDKTYRVQSRFCVIFVSKDYPRKYWTQFEQKRAEARAFYEKRRAYVLPFLLDDTVIRGLTDTVSYLTLKTHGASGLAEAIRAKIEHDKRRRLGVLHPVQQLLSRYRIAATVLMAAFLCYSFDLHYKLTPVQSLANHLYDESSESRTVSICRDGSMSRSQGSGTCSSHGGVDHKTDTVLYGKSPSDCLKEAQTLTWLP